MRNGRVAVRGGDEQQVDRLLDDSAARDVDERSVLHQGRVQGDEGVAAVLGVARQMRFHQLEIAVQGGCQAARYHAARQTVER